jgi:hypothetical protein
MTGTPNSAVFNSVDGNRETRSVDGLSFVATGSTFDEAHMCIMASDGCNKICAGLTSDRCSKEGHALSNLEHKSAHKTKRSKGSKETVRHLKRKQQGLS